MSWFDFFEVAFCRLVARGFDSLSLTHYFSLASMNSCAIAQIPSNVIIQICESLPLHPSCPRRETYQPSAQPTGSLHHPEYVSQAWHVFVVYIMITWSTCAICIFGNRFLPMLQKLCLFLVVAGFVITVVVLAAMPKVHATNDFVWKDFENDTGYQSNGVTFLTGVLNGAFVVRPPSLLLFPRTQFGCRADQRW